MKFVIIIKPILCYSCP